MAEQARKKTASKRGKKKLGAKKQPLIKDLDPKADKVKGGLAMIRTK